MTNFNIIDFLFNLIESGLHGRDQFNLAPKEQHPGNSQAKGPYSNNSGKQTKVSPKEQISQVP